jgi:outer membrane protein
MKRFFSWILAALILSAVPTLAAETKIGYVNLQKALNFSEAGKAAKVKIAEKVKEYEGIIGNRQKELEKLKNELEKQALLLSEEARAEKERNYQQKIKEFQRFTKDIQDELQQKDADYTRQILDSLLEVIKEIGEKEGYVLILEKAESSILYADDKINLTDELIKAYDAAYEKGNAK